MCTINRFFLGTLNFILTIVGIILFIIGLYLLNKSETTFRVFKDLLGLPNIINLPAPPGDNSIWIVQFAGWTVIFLSIAVAVISATGFVGAWKHQAHVLMTYSMLLAFLALCKYIAFGLLFVCTNRLENVLRDTLEPSMDSHYVPVSNFMYRDEKHWRKKSVTLFANSVQLFQNCCFVTPTVKHVRPKAWFDNDPTNEFGDPILVPIACCPMHEEARPYFIQINNWLRGANFNENPACPKTTWGMNEKSCFTEVARLVKENRFYIYLVVGGLALIETALLTLGILLALSPNAKFDRSYYG